MDVLTKCAIKLVPGIKAGIQVPEPVGLNSGPSGA